MITYLSESKIPNKRLRPELDRILEVAGKRNRELGITGVLFSRGNTFFQTIEGPANSVRDVYQSISTDDRHQDLYVLINEPVDKRRFPNWAMECFLDPDHEECYLELMHQVGRHLAEGSGFGPTSVYCYCWRTVAAMAAHRLAVSQSS